MAPKEIYRHFGEIFPEIASADVVKWYQYDANSIRYRTAQHEEFIFTYKAHDDWKLQTVRNCELEIKAMKKFLAGLIKPTSKMKQNRTE